MISYHEVENGIFLPVSKEELNIKDTLDCGQSFRFAQVAEGRMSGVAGNHLLHVTQGEEGVLFHDVTKEEFISVWAPYLDIEEDYGAVKRLLCQDPTLRVAISRVPGIRILQQDCFEMLLSFLISQNNNIPRIKASIERLCRSFGQPIGEGGVFSFPTPERISRLHLEELKGIGLGYRDRYLLDCARRVADGRLDLKAVAGMELPQAREALRTVSGIGPKVAECVLLFGFHRFDAFPVDTWMKKVLSSYYPQGFPVEFAPVAGIAQQYLFHAMRLYGNLDDIQSAG